MTTQPAELIFKYHKLKVNMIIIFFFNLRLILFVDFRITVFRYFLFSLRERVHELVHSPAFLRWIWNPTNWKFSNTEELVKMFFFFFFIKSVSSLHIHTNNKNYKINNTIKPYIIMLILAYILYNWMNNKT